MAVKRDTILVIEDDQTFSEFLQEVLLLEGYNVNVVPNGRAGLTAVREEKPDVILLDMQMPVLDGWAFLASYCRQADIQTPIIVMSGYVSRSSNLPYVAGILAKPFKMEELLEMVAKNVVTHQQ
jgi:DNA-binding response OmpR family regulator